MSNQDFIDDPDANRWSDAPKLAPQEPIQPGTPTEPVPPAEPVSPEPFITEPAPETVFRAEPLPEQPEPVIYDPVRDEHEPYVDVTPQEDGFESVPPVTKEPSSIQPPVEKKKTNGWIVALIVLLVLCICAIVATIVTGFLVVSGQYRIEWSYLIDSALRLL